MKNQELERTITELNKQIKNLTTEKNNKEKEIEEEVEKLNLRIEELEEERKQTVDLDKSVLYYYVKKLICFSLRPK